MNIKKPKIELRWTPEVFAALPPDLQREFLAIGAVVLTAAASIGGTIAKNIQEGNGIPNMDGSTKVEATLEDVNTPFGRTPEIFPTVVVSSSEKSIRGQASSDTFESGDIQVPIARQTRYESSLQRSEVEVRDIKAEEHKLLMKWAELFAADPEAKKFRTPAEAQSVIDSLQQIVADGYTIDSVELQGFASDEDDYSDTKPKTNNPGFGVRSIKNEQLADRRAEAAREVLRAVIVDQDIPIRMLLGKEVQDPEQAEDVFRVARKYKINPVRMVKLFNRNPHALPSEAVDVLAGLKDDRFVRVTIHAHKDSQVETVISTSRIAVDESARGNIDQSPSMAASTESHEDRKDEKLFILLVPLVLLPLIKAKVQFEDFGPRRSSSRGLRLPSTTTPVGSVELPTAGVPLEDLVKKALGAKVSKNKSDDSTNDTDNNPARSRSGYGKERAGVRAAALQGRERNKNIIKQPRPHNYHGARVPGREGQQPLGRDGRGYPR